MQAIPVAGRTRAQEPLVGRAGGAPRPAPEGPRRVPKGCGTGGATGGATAGPAPATSRQTARRSWCAPSLAVRRVLLFWLSTRLCCGRFADESRGAWCARGAPRQASATRKARRLLAGGTCARSTSRYAASTGLRRKARACAPRRVRVRARVWAVLRLERHVPQLGGLRVGRRCDANLPQCACEPGGIFCVCVCVFCVQPPDRPNHPRNVIGATTPWAEAPTSRRIDSSIQAVGSSPLPGRAPLAFEVGMSWFRSMPLTQSPLCGARP